MTRFYNYLTAIAILFFAPFFSSAQSNYQPGYVIDLKGDTIKGFIDYREWNKNPHSFNFKEQPQAKATIKYTTANCTAFSITGYEIYERYTLRISNDATNLSALSSGIDTATISGNFFLRTIITGKRISLYSYNDGKKSRFFIKTGNEYPKELTYHVYMNTDDVSRQVTDKGFKRQLQSIAAANQINDQSLFRSIYYASYDINDLTEIAEKINGETKRFKYSAGTKSQFFAGIGVNVSRTVVEGLNSLAGASSTTYGPSLTFGNDYYFNKNTGSLLIRTEMNFSYQATKLSLNKTNNVSEPYEYGEEYKYNQFIASFRPKLLYNFYNKNDFKTYLAAGPTVLLMPTFSKSDKVTFDKNPPVASNTYDMRSFTFCASAQAGVIVNKKLNVFIEYTPKMSATDGYLYFAFNTTIYRAGVNFIFGN